MSFAATLDREGKLPPFRQIADQIRAAIYSGALAAGERLPSVRELADALAVNPLTVARALNELESAGLIECRWGKGNFVKPISAKRLNSARHEALEDAVRAFISVSKRLGFSPAEAIAAIRTSLGDGV